jgi:hypothetical protein
MRAQPHLLGELYELDTLARALWSSKRPWLDSSKIKGPFSGGRPSGGGRGSREPLLMRYSQRSKHGHIRPVPVVTSTIPTVRAHCSADWQI